MKIELTTEEQVILANANRVFEPYFTTQLLKERLAEVIVVVSQMELYATKENLLQLKDNLDNSIIDALIILLQHYILEKDKFDNMFTDNLKKFEETVNTLHELKQEYNKKMKEKIKK